VEGTDILPARQNTDTDVRRRDLIWLASALIVALGTALFLVLYLGLDPFHGYDQSVLLVGLVVFLGVTVTYLACREREQRTLNRSLLASLEDAVHALNERISRLNSLTATSTQLAGTLDLDRISDLVVQALVEQVQATASSLVLVDRETGRSIFARQSSSDGDEAGLDHEEMLRTIARQCKPVLLPEDGQARSADLSDQLQVWREVRSRICAPLKIDDLVAGALAAQRDERFTYEDLNLLTTLANMAAKAIESAQAHQQLRQSYLKTLRALNRSLDARDNYTAVHGEQVTCMALLVAERLGVPEPARQALRDFGPLHDVGKIGISDEILKKPTPLTEAESRSAQEHVVIGEEIVRPLDPGPDVISMIRNHHERWDGRGYPDRLRGEEIPLLARIMAVADAYHAIISERPYRAAAAPPAAIRELRDNAGSQFDPTVVEVAAAVVAEGLLDEALVPA
jgi:hypothetical protein